MLISVLRYALAALLVGYSIGSFRQVTAHAEPPSFRGLSAGSNRAPNPELLREHEEKKALFKKDGLSPEESQQLMALLEDAYNIRQRDFPNKDDWYRAILLAEERHQQRLTAYKPVLGLKGNTASEDIYVYEQTPEHKAKRTLSQNRNTAFEIRALRRHLGTWNPELDEELDRAVQMGEQGGAILRRELNSLENHIRADRQIKSAVLLDLKRRLHSGRISLEEYIQELLKH
jgi:hypothetical protein